MRGLGLHEMVWLVRLVAWLLGVAFVLTSAAAAAPATSGLIAFTRYRLQNRPLWSEIWVMRPDGSHAVKASHSSAAVEDDQAHFSPDGRWITFQRCVDNGPCAVAIVRPDGTGQHILPVPCRRRPCDNSGPSFAPDGRHLVFAHEWGTVRHGAISDNDQIEHSSIVETALDGSHLVVLRRLDNWRGGLEGPRFTPDGRKLVFRSYAWRPDRVTPAALYVAALAGGPATRLTAPGLDAGGASISPDGAHVLFHSTIAGSELTPGNALYTVGIDGRGLRRILPASPYGYVLTGSFSPDGGSVVFATNAANPGGFASVVTIDLRTGRQAQLTHAHTLDGWPSWGRR